MKILIAAIVVQALSVNSFAQSFKDADGKPCTNLTNARIQVLKKIGDHTYSVIVGGFMAPRQNIVLITSVTEFQSMGVVRMTTPVFVEVNNKKISIDMENGFKNEFPLATETKACHEMGMIALAKQKKESAEQAVNEHTLTEAKHKERVADEQKAKAKKKEVDDLWK